MGKPSPHMDKWGVKGRGIGGRSPTWGRILGGTTQHKGKRVNLINNKVYFNINESSLDISEKVIKFLKGKKRDPLKVKSYKKHFELFLNFYVFKPGKYWVTGNALFYLYDKWAYDTKKKTMSYQHFSNYCKLYFQYKNKNHKDLIWFRVNRENLFKHISKERLKDLEVARKKRSYVKGKNKTWEDEISKSQARTKFKNSL